MNLFIWGEIIVVVLVALFGFVVAGSPQSQRLVRFDGRRVNDLQLIQSQVVNYWQNKQKLPQSLDDLRNDIYGVTISVDPKTGVVYEYTAIGDLQFRLCANFETASQNSGRILYPETMPVPAGGGYPIKGDTWEHSIGRVCFERTIDPQLIKPIK